ncbi:MAG: hypothetical protein QXG08_03575 [Candidatus Methanomethyliaceae archaeon]
MAASPAWLPAGSLRSGPGGSPAPELVEFGGLHEGSSASSPSFLNSPPSSPFAPSPLIAPSLASSPVSPPAPSPTPSSFPSPPSLPAPASAQGEGSTPGAPVATPFSAPFSTPFSTPSPPPFNAPLPSPRLRGSPGQVVIMYFSTAQYVMGRCLGAGPPSAPPSSSSSAALPPGGPPRQGLTLPSQRLLRRPPAFDVVLPVLQRASSAIALSHSSGARTNSLPSRLLARTVAARA